MAAYTYTVHRIPKSSSQLSILTQAYKRLRLSALQASPSAFSSTYALESTFTDDAWVQRLQRPNIETFVCVTTPNPGSTAEPEKDCSVEPEDVEENFIKGEWVGSVILLGPFPQAEYELPEAQHPYPLSEDDTRWQMGSLYVEAAHRGHGLAKLLCRAGVGFAAGHVRTGGRARVRIIIKPENTVIKKLYEGMGFVDVGKATLAEALRVNGDANLIPDRGDVEKYHVRMGLVMEKLVHV